MTLLSIIIVTKNNFEDLNRTLDSLREIIKDVEIVVVDGAINSNLKELKYRIRCKNYIYLEGPDDGIYHGMNRGLSIATGEYIFFLNSGDIYSSDRQLMQILDAAQYYKIKWLIGGQKPKTRLGVYPKKYCDKLLILGLKPLPHQSSIMHRDIFKTLGGFNTALRIEADQEFFLRAIASGYKPTILKTIISHRKIGGIGDQQQAWSFTKQINAISIQMGKWNSLYWRLTRKLVEITRRLGF